MGIFHQEKGKLPSQPIQNPQGQNSVGVSGPSEGTFEHCKAVTTLRSAKVVDKTIRTKEPSQESQSESVRDDEVSDKPYVPKTNVIDGEPEEDKATHIIIIIILNKKFETPDLLYHFCHHFLFTNPFNIRLLQKYPIKI